MPMSGVQVRVMTLVMTLVTSRTSPGPRASWSSYSWGLHHQDEQFAESWTRKINIVALLASLHDSLLVFVLLETICVVQLMLQCCSLCRMLHRKWLMAGWRLFTLRMRSAVVTRSRHKTSAMSRCQKINEGDNFIVKELALSLNTARCSVTANNLAIICL